MKLFSWLPFKVHGPDLNTEHPKSGQWSIWYYNSLTLPIVFTVVQFRGYLCSFGLDLGNCLIIRLLCLVFKRKRFLTLTNSTLYSKFGEFSDFEKKLTSLISNPQFKLLKLIVQKGCAWRSSLVLASWGNCRHLDVSVTQFIIIRLMN